MCARKCRYMEQITGTNTAGMHGVERYQNERKAIDLNVPLWS